ncbi:hypothetical protein [Bacillus piscicola]|uniref:hypothetical protein n=1 Tax=Bacillus piscicola TaxID=1632684 RepID=UPI001F09D650|nr:hypothetical protein [Bacillus piscicola]
MEKRKQITALMQEILTESENNPTKTTEQVIYDLSCKLRQIYTDYQNEPREG